MRPEIPETPDIHPPVNAPFKDASLRIESDQVVLRPLANLNRVYCAGPLFNDAERQQMDQIAAALESAGFETFVPHRDGMQLAALTEHLVEQGYDPEKVQQWLLQAIFALDSYQLLVRCGCLVFNCSGRVPDEGSVSESAMAWTTGKPVIYFKFGDTRSLVGGVDNPMLTGLAQFRSHSDIDSLGDGLKQLVSEFQEQREYEIRVPPHVAATLKEGEQIAAALDRIGGDRSNADRTSLVGSLIVSLYGTSGSTAL